MNIRDIIAGALLDGQNQIHDLRSERATPSEITDRMFKSVDYWEKKALGVEPVELTPTEEKCIVKDCKICIKIKHFKEPTPSQDLKAPLGLSDWERVANLPGQINPIYNSKDLKVPEKIDVTFPLNTLGETLLLQELMIKYNALIDYLRSKEDK